LLELLPTAQSMLEYDCSQPYLQCDGVFSNPKSLEFDKKGESSALAIQLRAEGEPLLRTSPNFSLRGPQSHAIRQRRKRNTGLNALFCLQNQNIRGHLIIQRVQ